MAGTYRITTNDTVLTHGRTTSRLLRDHPDEPNFEADALVASGDCFITLATTLDGLDKTLAEEDAAIQPELEQVVRTLLYLQRHYQIVKKPSNYRQ